MKKIFLRLSLFIGCFSFLLKAYAEERRGIEDPLSFKTPTKTLLVISDKKLFQYNPSTLKQEQTYSFKSPLSLVTSNGEYIFIANESLPISPRIQLNNQAELCNSIPYITQIDPIKKSMIKVYPLEKNPMHMVTIGEKLYVQEEDNQITEISISQQRTIKRYDIKTSSSFTISPSQDVLLISFFKTHQISLLDPHTQSITSWSATDFAFDWVKAIGNQTFFSDNERIGVFNNQLKKIDIKYALPNYSIVDWLYVGNKFMIVSNKKTATNKPPIKTPEVFTPALLKEGKMVLKKVTPYEQVKIYNKENTPLIKKSELSYSVDNVVSLGNKYIALSSPVGVFIIDPFCGITKKIHHEYYPESILELKSDAYTLFFYTKGSKSFHGFNALNNTKSEIKLPENSSIDNVFLF